MSFLPPLSSVSRLPDDQLVQLVLSDDDTAIGDFLNRYCGLIYSVLLRMCGLPENRLPEALHYALLGLFSEDCRRLRAWRGESSLSTFLLAEARSLGREYRNQLNSHREGTEGQAFLKTGGSNDHIPPEPEDETIVNRMENAMREMSDSMEEECRKIIYLKFMRDMSYKETAFASGVPAGSVESRLQRCLEGLARRMKTRFPDLFEDRFNFEM